MLSERQKLILAAIVMDYIRFAEPIGSRTISRRGDFQLSPATIRNEMSDLEEMGFLQQPHTSAGRIPSEKGYRFYVDHLLRFDEWSLAELPDLREMLSDKFMTIERVIQQSADILSQFTQYTAFVMKKDGLLESLRHLQLLPLSERTAVVLIVSNIGQVDNKMVEIPTDISMVELERMFRVLNEKLVGVPLYQFRTKLYQEISEVLQHNAHKYEKAMNFIESLLAGHDGQNVYVGGSTNILSQPEFQDVQKVKMILEMLQQTTKLADVIGRRTSGLDVKIGTENSDRAFSDCSIVTATYQLDGKDIGTIGVLGPTRMDYAKVMTLIQHLSAQLSETLGRWYR